ncbi:hypothetical protein E4U55_008211 [Claviceps digitariae]|nr:hypothetical protein E4U55_008211 [Claviceps digitariae]
MENKGNKLKPQSHRVWKLQANISFEQNQNGCLAEPSSLPTQAHECACDSCSSPGDPQLSARFYSSAKEFWHTMAESYVWTSTKIPFILCLDTTLPLQDDGLQFSENAGLKFRDSWAQQKEIWRK